MSTRLSFPEAYDLLGPDVEEIAKVMEISPAFADKLINARMNFGHSPVNAAMAIKQEYQLRKRDRLRAVRDQHRAGA